MKSQKLGNCDDDQNTSKLYSQGKTPQTNQKPDKRTPEFSNMPVLRFSVPESGCLEVVGWIEVLICNKNDREALARDI
jgi:hypothetical protein